MIVVLMIVTALALSFGIALLIQYLQWYPVNKGKNAVTMKWDMVLKLYVIAPDKWDITEDRILYYYYSPEKHTAFHIYLSFFDDLKCQRWLKHQQAWKQQQQEKENLETLIKSCQKDIDIFRQQSREKLNKI